jgi:hypothetical protein
VSKPIREGGNVRWQGPKQFAKEVRKCIIKDREKYNIGVTWGVQMHFYLRILAEGANTKYKYFLNDYLGCVKAERNENWNRDMVDPHPPMLLTNFFLWR